MITYIFNLFQSLEVVAYLHYLNLNIKFRIDPLFFLIAKIVGLGEGKFPDIFYLFYQFFILSVGNFCIFRQQKLNIKRAMFWTLAMLIVVSAISLYITPIYFLFFWFPFLLFAIKKLYFVNGHNSRKMTVFCYAVILNWILTSGLFSFFGLVLSFLFCIAENWRIDWRYDSAPTQRKSTSYLKKFFVFTIFTLSYVLIPVYQMPEYPSGARLAPISSLDGLWQPYIGASLVPNPIYFQAWKYDLKFSTYYLAFFYVLLFLGILSKFIFRTNFRISYLGMVLLFCPILFSGLFLSDKFSWGIQNWSNPYVVLLRVMPGLALVVLPWLLVPFFILMGFYFLTASLRGISGNIVLSIFLIVGLGVNGFKLFAERGRGAEYVTYQFSQTLKELPKVEQLKISQAGYLAKSFGEKFLKTPYKASDFRQIDFLEHGQSRLVETPKPISNTFSPNVFSPNTLRSQPWQQTCELISAASEYVAPKIKSDTFEYNADIFFKTTQGDIPLNQANAYKLLDGRVDTAWSTNPPQVGGEQIDIYFNKLQKLKAIKLELGRRSGEFPRGLQVFYRAENGRLQEVINISDWVGSIAWTEEGTPYFTAQQIIFIPFVEEITTKQLKLVQTSEDKLFAWSVAEIYFYN